MAMVVGGNKKTITGKRPNTFYLLCDRTTVVGNPFFMKTEKERNEVCEKYEAYFWKTLVHKTEVVEYLQQALDALASGRDGCLVCWCAPKRCHTATIANYLIGLSH